MSDERVGSVIAYSMKELSVSGEDELTSSYDAFSAQPSSVSVLMLAGSSSRSRKTHRATSSLLVRYSIHNLMKYSVYSSRLLSLAQYIAIVHFLALSSRSSLSAPHRFAAWSAQLPAIAASMADPARVATATMLNALLIDNP